MSKEAHILVVDDTPDGRLMLTMLLEERFNITEAEDGESALQTVAESIPDVVLLDVEMPGMNGYEVCTELRKRPDTAQLPIIFVSGLDSTEERLAGFEAGANDYLIKPIDAEKLLKKVDSVLEAHRQTVQAKAEASDAMTIAMEAMTVSSELGQIVQFVKQADTHKDGQGVAQALLEITGEFGLDAVVRVTSDKVAYVGCEPDSLEAKILDRFTGHSERIFSVGVRTIIRSDYAEMLIKNMPLDDENRYGRVKDHLAVLVDIANGQLTAITMQLKADAQRHLLLKDVIEMAEQQIKKTTDRIAEHDAATRQIMENMVIDLEEMLFGLGLEDDQEKRLMALAEQTTLTLQNSETSTDELSKDLGAILEKLYNIV